ncbi:hypothetical protein SAMN05519103_00369 [Rhizobiales bacterium GAS113]|nr:hypothetical protein SAMN05519103_00369 [Rhizobiales bacterium GAS113]
MLAMPHLNEGQKTNLAAIVLSTLCIIVTVSMYVGKIGDRVDTMERRVETLERTKDADHDVLTRLDANVLIMRGQLERLTNDASQRIPRSPPERP